MSVSPTLLLATTNAGKLREFQAVLADLPIRLTSLADFPPFPEPVEDADTFAGNAALKARHYARLANCWTLADDSGLEVDALDGAPGVYSARFADLSGDDAANNTKLIQMLAGVSMPRRTAHFRCVLVLASPSEILATASGSLEGLMVDDPRGSNGFGYDPHFLVPELGLTAAQLSPEQKNRISHRGQALRVMLPQIERLLV